MASRWMQGMKARERRHQRQLANSATTITERKFERRKVKINKHGVIIGIETLDEHIERQRLSAKSESASPKEWRRVYARIQSITSIRELPLNGDEQTIIRRKMYREPVKHRSHISDELIESNIGDIKLLPNETISTVELAILRYRRLVRPAIEREKQEAKANKLRVKLEAIKGKR